MAVLRGAPSRARAAARGMAARRSTIILPAAEHGGGVPKHRPQPLAKAGLLDIVVPAAETGARASVDVRALCLAREASPITRSSPIRSSPCRASARAPLDAWDGRAEGAVSAPHPFRRGDRRLRAHRARDRIGRGQHRGAGRAAGRRYVLNGEKTFISNAPFADHYIVVARTGEAPGSRGLSAFIVDADAPGLTAGAPIDLMAPHPAGPLTFERLPRAGRQPDRRARQGFRHRHGDLRHLPHLGRRGGDRHGAARPRRDAGACQGPPAVRQRDGRDSPACSRSSPTWRSISTSARWRSIAPRGPRT